MRDGDGATAVHPMRPHAAIVLGLLATASVAETPPALVPTQDVTVTYHAPA